MRPTESEVIEGSVRTAADFGQRMLHVVPTGAMFGAVVSQTRSAGRHSGENAGRFDFPGGGVLRVHIGNGVGHTLGLTGVAYSIVFVTQEYFESADADDLDELFAWIAGPGEQQALIRGRRQRA